jgi:hypothetical protein
MPGRGFAGVGGRRSVGSVEFTDTTEDYTLLDHIGVQHALLLQVVRNGILGEERSLEVDLGTDPLTFAVGLHWQMFTRAAGTELRTKGGGLDLVELLKVRPGFDAPGARYIDFESHRSHEKHSNHGGIEEIIVAGK